MQRNRPTDGSKPQSAGPGTVETTLVSVAYGGADIGADVRFLIGVRIYHVEAAGPGATGAGATGEPREVARMERALDAAPFEHGTTKTFDQPLASHAVTLTPDEHAAIGYVIHAEETDAFVNDHGAASHGLAGTDTYAPLGHDKAQDTRTVRIPVRERGKAGGVAQFDLTFHERWRPTTESS